MIEITLSPVRQLNELRITIADAIHATRPTGYAKSVRLFLFDLMISREKIKNMHVLMNKKCADFIMLYHSISKSLYREMGKTEK